MLVCNVSLRPPARMIAADLAEAAAAVDVVTRSIGIAALLDEPVSASDTLDAFVGHIMVEAASASDTTDAGLIYNIAIDEPAAAVDASEATYAGGIAADVVEAATATDDPSATVTAAPSDEWTLVDSWTYSGDVAQLDFTGLAGYTEVRIVLRNVSSTSGLVRRLRVSTDNGSTFLSTSGDYIEVPATGIEGNTTNIPFISATSGAARSAEILISGWNLTVAKSAEVRNRTDLYYYIIPTTSALNALRIYDVANLTGGSVYVFAR